MKSFSQFVLETKMDEYSLDSITNWINGKKYPTQVYNKISENSNIKKIYRINAQRCIARFGSQRDQLELIGKTLHPVVDHELAATENSEIHEHLMKKLTDETHPESDNMKLWNNIYSWGSPNIRKKLTDHIQRIIKSTNR